jgi:hypothetical protein
MASCSSPNDSIRIETAFIRHTAFTEILGYRFRPKNRRCRPAVFSGKLPLMEAEIASRSLIVVRRLARVGEMNIKVTSVDYEPEDVYAQTPLSAPL